MSTRDKPFQALSEVARERRDSERDEQLWLARASGQLGEQELRELGERAASDEEARTLLELTNPALAPDEDALERKVLEVLGQPTEQKASVSVLEPKRSKRPLLLGASILAVAAATLLVVRPSTPPAHVLPSYDGDLTGTDVRVRSDAPPSAGRKTVSRGAWVALAARPAEPLVGHPALQGRVFLMQGKRMEPVALSVEVADGGGLRVAAPYAAWFGERSGDWDVILFVASPESMPTTSAAARACVSDADCAAQKLRFSLRLTPSSRP